MMTYRRARRKMRMQRMKHVTSVILRDSLRTEATKQRALADDMRDRQDQLRRDIVILNMMIESQS